jgi:hypothetical protein
VAVSRDSIAPAGISNLQNNHKMKNVTLRFTVYTNNNVYWATSLKAAVSYCKKHDFVIDRDWDMTPSIGEQNKAEKCGRGVYCILETPEPH